MNKKQAEQLQELLKLVTVIPDEEYQERLVQPDTILLAGKESLFNDDRSGTCTGCGAVIYFRPYNATADRKLCIPCFAQLKKGDPQQ